MKMSNQLSLASPQGHTPNPAWLIPTPPRPVTLGDMTSAVPESQFMELILDLTEAELLRNQTLADSLADLAAVTDPELQRLVFAGLGHIHSMYGDYLKAFAAFHRALKGLDSLQSGEALAFVYSSLQNLLRKLGHHRATVILAEEALRLTTNELLQWRIRVQRVLADKYRSHPGEAIQELNKACQYFRSIGNRFREARTRKHIAHLYATQRNWKQARIQFRLALETAKGEHRPDFVHELKGDLAYLDHLEGNHQAAIRQLESLSQEELIPYQEALVYQNLGVIEASRKRYRSAISSFRKSLSITSKHGMQELLLEDLYRLAVLYEKTGELGTAGQFWARAHAAVVNDLRIGLPLTRFRSQVLEEALGFFHSHSDLSSDLSDQDPSSLFRGTLTESRTEFQKILLALHLTATPTQKQIAQKLGLTPRSLHLYKSRWRLDQPDIREEVLSDTKQRRWVEGFLRFTWKDATRQFEERRIQQALRLHGFNKKKAAAALGISYPSLLTKTGKKEELI
ncbi:MAG: hypothetical protein D6762_06495 [Candidatus Neomarinimicrobiota bacterium]|nr:MAG: hypothetical protein D6762_06495 [Candidatus Neomarinimicrobiota bacterium]